MLNFLTGDVMALREVGLQIPNHYSSHSFHFILAKL